MVLWVAKLLLKVKKVKSRFFWRLFFLSLVVFSVQEGYSYEGSHQGILKMSDCHTDFPVGINTAEGNVNLCLSCHTGGAIASNLPLYSVDQATITSGGVYGKSHRWDAVALQTVSQGYSIDIATDPTKTYTYTRKRRGGETTTVYVKGFTEAKVFPDKSGVRRIACSSCHNRNTASYLRNEKERDEKLCKDCHGPMQWHGSEKGRVNVYTGQGMNHPTKSIGSNYVGCSSCHEIHAK